MPWQTRNELSGYASETVTCKKCGHTYRASATASSLGRGTTATQAVANARSAATRDASEMIRLAPCPQCGRRDFGAVGGCLGCATLPIGAMTGLAVYAYVNHWGKWVPHLFGFVAVGLLVFALVHVFIRPKRNVTYH
jgi:hypothetical protein